MFLFSHLTLSGLDRTALIQSLFRIMRYGGISLISQENMCFNITYLRGGARELMTCHRNRGQRTACGSSFSSPHGYQGSHSVSGFMAEPSFIHWALYQPKSTCFSKLNRCYCFPSVIWHNCWIFFIVMWFKDWLYWYLAMFLLFIKL